VLVSWDLVGGQFQEWQTGKSCALAYIVFFQILRRSGATNVMLVTLLIPVTAILLGVLVLGEKISLREIAGALVIGSALLLIDGRVLKFFQR
jgi:drug/metabolite transporter (DMT)-like permease